MFLLSVFMFFYFLPADYLREQLDKYMAQFPKVRILRLKERQGLIRARIAGADIAKGKQSLEQCHTLIQCGAICACSRGFVAHKRRINTVTELT